MRLLVFEGVRAGHGALLDLLLGAGHDVTPSDTNDDAVAVLASDAALDALVIGHTPGGPGLCRSAKALAHRADTPVVVVVSPEEPEHVRAAVDCGADGLLVDPVGQEQVVQLLGLLRETGDETGPGPAPVVVELSGRPLAIAADHEQIVALLTASFEALTEANRRLRTQQQMTEMQERGQQALAASRVATWTYSPRTQRFVWSSGAHEVLGLPPDACIDRFEDYLSHIHPDDRPGIRQLESRVRPGQPPLPEEWDTRILRPDGEIGWLTGRGQRMHETAEGELLASGVILDNTSRKRLEEQLAEARRQADAANAAKTEYVSRLSHELRTPLTTVIGWAQLLETEELSDSAAEAIPRIRQGGQHLLGLVDDVLDIAQIESGRVSVTMGSVAVGPLLHEVAGMVDQLAADRGVVLTITDAPSPEVLADRQRLTQALLNLTANAIKYIQPGGHVHLDVADVDDHVRIEVRDDGPGIPPEQVSRLFRLFDRLDADHGDQPGSGLGLPISRSLTELMGGRLDVDTTVGVGSTFYVELPRAPSPD